MPYEDIPMPSRREMLDAGERLRASDPFAGLSAGEATALRRLMKPREVAAGDAVVRQGDEGGSLFVIEAGEAEVHVTDAAGRTRVARTLGVGDHFGEISLLGSRARTADVLALTSMQLLELSKDAYEQYVSGVSDVGAELRDVAASRLASDDRA